MRFPPFSMTLPRRRLALIALAAGATPVLAQNTQAPPPANGQLPQTIPGLDNFSIAPRTPMPMPVPTPTPTPVPNPVRVMPIQPLPSPTPTPRAARTPRPAPAPSPTPTPTPSAAPTEAAPPPAIPAPIVTPTSAATATPAIAPSRAPRHSLLWVALFIAMLLLPAFGIVLWFLRRSPTGTMPAEAVDDDDDDWIAPDQVTSAPVAAPTPIAPPRRMPGTSARPQLEIAFVPRRAGANVTSAAVDYDLIVRNAGAAAADDVHVRVELVTAGNAHDAELQALLGRPIDKPVTAPFALSPGEERGLRALVMLPKNGINVVTVKGRPMFVPIVVIDLRYRWQGGEGQTAESFVVGIRPKEGERMRPFWLDVPPRMYDTVTAHPHAVTAKQ